MSRSETRFPLRLPSPILALVSKLPQFPGSVGLAIGLTAILRPLLSAEALQALQGRVVGIQVDDAGIDLRVRLGSRGFIPLRSSVPAEVKFCATAYDFYLMARRLEDPDTLFFNRRLRIEGDTELGLVVKNSLDAIDWQDLPAPLRALMDRWAGLVAAIKCAPGSGAGVRASRQATSR